MYSLVLVYMAEIIQKGRRDHIYLSKSAFSLDHFICHKQWDEGEGDRCNKPPQDVSPEWVDVRVAEL